MARTEQRDWEPIAVFARAQALNLLRERELLVGTLRKGSMNAGSAGSRSFDALKSLPLASDRNFPERTLARRRSSRT